MSCKLFLGGVRPGTSEKLLEDHFSRFGPVSEAVVMRDKDFGFVTFETVDAADAALSEPQQTIDGQTIDVKPATGKRDRDGGDRGGDRNDRGGRGGGGGGGGRPTVKVFVGGLPQDCSNETIREHFETYGHIVDAIVMKDRDTGRSKGFGFVQFDSPDAVNKVIADYDVHKIAGKWVEVKASIPKDEMDSNPRGGRRDDRDSRHGSRDGGGGSGGRDSSAYSRDGYHGGAPPSHSAYGVAHPGMYGGLPPPPMYGAYGAAYGAYGYPGYSYPGYGYPCAYGMPPPASAYGRPSGSGKDEYGAYGAYGAAPPPAAKPDRGSRSSPY